MSPRTKFIHFRKNAATLGSVVVVVHHLEGFLTHLFATPKPDGINERLTNRF